MNADRTDTPLGQAIVALHGLLAQLEGAEEPLRPWRDAGTRPRLAGRVSATDQLSWWFRPSVGGEDPWADYFSGHGGDLDAADALGPGSVDGDALGPLDGGWLSTDPLDGGRLGSTPGGAARPQPPSRRTALQMLLAEPEEELLDGDAEAVVTCMYDFVHAVGRRDVEAAMTCVAPDYSTMEDDREIDAERLAAGLRALLDPLHGWDLDAFLVEIPQPVLHPAGILVPVEIQLDARQPETDARRTVVHRRIAVFDRQPDRSWRIVALSTV